MTAKRNRLGNATTQAVVSDGFSPAERKLRARLAAHALHAKYGSDTIAARARAGFLARFEREVDPDGVLDPAERARRAEHAKRAYFTRLALKSARARRKAAELNAQADAIDAELLATTKGGAT